MLAENVEGIANATETVEMLNQAQENLQEVAKNPGIGNPLHCQIFHLGFSLLL